MSKGTAATSTHGGWPIALGISVFYTAAMALIWVISTQPYAKAHLLLAEIWWAIAALAVVTVLIARWTGLRVQRSLRLSWYSLLLIVPVLIAVGGLLHSMASGVPDWRVMALVIVGTLFVGIGEEVAFRGIALNALGEKVTVVWAVVASSLLFSLMHLANLINSEAKVVAPQLVITFLAGLVFGWVYVSTGGNLVLVIVMHWLYDAALLGGLATDPGSNQISALAPLIIAAVGIVSTVVFGIKHKGRRLSDLLAP